METITSPYAMRVMQDTPDYVRINGTVASLTTCEQLQGWDTPISGDMLRRELFTAPLTEHPTTTTRRYAIGSITPLWGQLGHHVWYVNDDGDSFIHYPSDPNSVPTYMGRQITT